MSICGRKISGGAMVAVVIGVLTAVLAPAMTLQPDREVTLVVRGMAFYAEGDFERPNPTIRVRAGERVRVVVRNEERGLTHDFAVPALDEATSLLAWHESDDVTFAAPSRPGTYEYVCNPHRAMMKGTLQVD